MYRLYWRRNSGFTNAPCEKSQDYVGELVGFAPTREKVEPEKQYKNKSGEFHISPSGSDHLRHEQGEFTDSTYSHTLLLSTLRGKFVVSTELCPVSDLAGVAIRDDLALIDSRIDMGISYADFGIFY